MTLDIQKIVEWVGRVGWTAPYSKCTTAQIAVKIVGVKFGYGRWMFEVEPLAGVGTWLVGTDRVYVDRGEGL